MKILQINKFYYLKGGAERYFFDLSEILRRNGNEVLHFSMADEKNMDTGFVKYFTKNVEFDAPLSVKKIFSSSKIFYNYSAANKLETLIKQEKPDIAHLHNIAHQLSPAVIMTLKKNNIPTIQTLHDYKLICPNYKLFNKKICQKCKGKKYYNCFLNKCMGNSSFKSFLGMSEAYLHNVILKTYDNVDLFIAPTEFVRNECVKFGVSDKKIIALNYFLSREMFVEHNKNLVKGIPENNYLLYFGRLSAEKGIEVLIDSLGKIKQDVNLKIIGSGPLENAIKKHIMAKKMILRIKISEAKHGEELRTEIAGAKAIIVPSVWPETLGYVLIEAMAMGKVVIASRIGGMREFIEDGVNGFLFEPGNVNELTDKINKLDKFDLYEIGLKARERVADLNEENHYGKIMEIYDLIIKKGNSITGKNFSDFAISRG